MCDFKVTLILIRAYQPDQRRLDKSHKEDLIS